GRESLPQLATLDAVDDCAHCNSFAFFSLFINFALMGREKTAQPESRAPRGCGMVATPRPSRTARLARGSVPPSIAARARDLRRGARRAPPSPGRWVAGCSAGTRAPPPASG